MSGNKPEQLFQLADIDKNTQIYKLFEEEINFLDHFFSFEKYSKNINNIESLQEFINDQIFINFQQHFETFVRSSNFNYFTSLFDFLSFLYKIRPKYLPILVLITPIALDYYSPYIKEIKNYFLNQSKKTILYPLLFRILNEYQNFKENLFNESTKEINIKLIQRELLQHPEYLTLCSYMTKFQPQYLSVLDKSQETGEPIDERLNEIITIIIQDDYNELISFLLRHPNFKINSNIKIPLSHELYQLIKTKSISPINLCCFFGSIQCFKYFYMNSCRFSRMTNKYGIIGGNYEIFQILNQNDVDFSNRFSYTIKYHQYSLSDWLLTNYSVEPFSIHSCLLQYNMKYFLFINYNTFHDYILLPNGDDPTENKSNIIQEFCYIGYFSIVEYLIKIGCNKESITKSKHTPLHLACLNGHLPIVEYLIQNGCNKECQDSNMKTPLHIACEKGYFSIVEYLITNGCNKESTIGR